MRKLTNNNSNNRFILTWVCEVKRLIEDFTLGSKPLCSVSFLFFFFTISIFLTDWVIWKNCTKKRKPNRQDEKIYIYLFSNWWQLRLSFENTWQSTEPDQNMSNCNLMQHKNTLICGDKYNPTVLTRICSITNLKETQVWKEKGGVAFHTVPVA